MNAFKWVFGSAFGQACSSLLHPARKRMKSMKKLNKNSCHGSHLKNEKNMCDVPELPFENKVWMSTHDNVGGLSQWKAASCHMSGIRIAMWPS